MNNIALSPVAGELIQITADVAPFALVTLAILAFASLQSIHVVGFSVLELVLGCCMNSINNRYYHSSKCSFLHSMCDLIEKYSYNGNPPRPPAHKFFFLSFKKRNFYLATKWNSWASCSHNLGYNCSKAEQIQLNTCSDFMLSSFMLCIHFIYSLHNTFFILHLYKHYYYDLQNADMTSLKASILDWLVVSWWNVGHLEVVHLERWIVVGSSAIV